MTHLRVTNGIQGKFELGLVGLMVSPDPIQLSGCVRADKGNAKPRFMPLFLCRWRIHCLVFSRLSLLSGPCSACDQYDGLGFFTLYTDRSLFLSSLALHFHSLCLIICQNWQKKKARALFTCTVFCRQGHCGNAALWCFECVEVFVGLGPLQRGVRLPVNQVASEPQ